MSTVVLQLSDAVEQALRVRAVAQGRDIASVVLDLVERGLQDATPNKMAHELTPEERLQAFEDHMKDVERRPKIGTVVDCSRESIYEGRGE
jgi:hypothetical protein